MLKATCLKERAIVFSSGTGKEIQDTQVKLKRPYKYLRKLRVSPEARFLSVMDSIFCWNLLQSKTLFATGCVFGIHATLIRSFFSLSV